MRFSIALLGSLLATVSATALTRPHKRANSTGYTLKKGPLDTPWTDKVGTNPWPEYPRPQLQRSDWMTLNGVWQYENTTQAGSNNPPFGQDLQQAVLVPFCLESAISGIMADWAIWSWYRTTFDVPASWSKDNRVLLNFGAVDYEATIFVNGHNMTKHVGGYFAFTVDVTDYLSKNGTNELIVLAHDPTDSGTWQIPLGKQTLDRGQHIFYTPCSGIWQSVWIESAPADYITQLDVSADMNGKVNMTIHTAKDISAPLEIEFSDGKTYKWNDSCKSNSWFLFEFDSPDLWSPDSPTLYNFTVKYGGDVVESYTGFRTISRGVVDGVQRPLLNGEFIFQFGTLDQGFWPDGIYTAPSKEAMEYDLKVLKEIGYNMLRKHIKVEPALFYRACDEMGLMLIQDMPAMTPNVPDPTYNGTCDAPNVPVGYPSAQKEFERELAILIEQHKSYPSIVTWIIYNEGWGQETYPKYPDDPEFRLTDMIKSLDPTRLVDSVTGWYDHGAGDFHDNHHYANPQCGTPFYSIQSTPYDNRRIGMQGEFGGIGMNTTIDHLWNVQASIDTINQTYEINETPQAWDYRAHVLLSELRDQIEMYACSAAIWTQTTDVEGEVNGMMTYDRRVIRADIKAWNADTSALYDAAADRGGKKNEKSSSRMKSRDAGFGAGVANGLGGSMGVV